MKITEERLAGLLWRCDSHIDAVMVNATDLRELVRGYRIGLATEAAPVIDVMSYGEPFVKLPDCFKGQQVRIVPAELSGATTGSGE